MQLLARARTPWTGAGLLLLAALLLRPHEPTRTAIRIDAAYEPLAHDVWTEHRTPGEAIDIVVTERELLWLERRGIAYEVLDRDIDATATAERTRVQAVRPGDDFFADYRDLAEIGEHLSSLARLAPERASLHAIGGSIEGRPILALRIGNGGTKMLVNGTQHAREWIATAVSTCIADRMVRDYDRDPRVKAFVDSTELWVVPLVNPDGYQFTWARDRYWRKNRRGAFGVDLNRNWGVGFGGRGSSNSKRNETYRGEYAFSEPETQALRDLAMRERFALHVDFHSYGQLLLYPWAHTGTHAPDRDRYRAIADRMASAMYAAHEQAYRLSSGADFYPASGIMTDWMYGEAKALSYTIELRPAGRGGARGFVLPPEQIRPTCDEAFAAVLEMRRAI